MTGDTDRQFTGKYEESGGVGGWLIDRFYGAVRELLEPVVGGAETLLEVGCGAGFSTERLRAWLPKTVSFMTSDLGQSLVRKTRVRNPTVPATQQSVYALASADKSIDVLIMMEVLEHLEHPDQALAELARVARGHVLISTPREPIWRVLNMARGKYLAELGNTPGHIQHWSSTGLCRTARTHFYIAGIRQPLPWTILLLTPRE